VAEWLRTGLQNRVRRFNSGRGLQGAKRGLVAAKTPARADLPALLGCGIIMLAFFAGAFSGHLPYDLGPLRRPPVFVAGLRCVS
jgi:hypothetical protein